jgi:RimJ/RimL family protein N-acetyltransferase
MPHFARTRVSNCDHLGMSVIVRPASADDIDALLDVQEAGAIAGLTHIFPQHAYPFPRAAVRRRWTEELDDPATHVYISVDDGGALTGFAATRGNELLHFGTAPHTWGTGTAQQLHAALLDELARTAPEGSDHLRLRVFEANSRARRFYAKLGWSQTGQRTRSSFAPYPVLVEYQRTLATLVDRGDR